MQEVLLQFQMNFSEEEKKKYQFPLIRSSLQLVFCSEAAKRLLENQST